MSKPGSVLIAALLLSGCSLIEIDVSDPQRMAAQKANQWHGPELKK